MKFDWLRQESMTPPGYTKVNKSLMDDLRRLQPGTFKTVTDEEGNKFVMLNWEDFVFVIEQAGMGTESV